MNFSELPKITPDLNQLRKELQLFCDANRITRFEPDDIWELLQDGEQVEWMVEQLQQDNADLDSERLTGLLSAIYDQVAPSAETEQPVDAPSETTPEIEADMFPPSDLSQLELDELKPHLEAMTGRKLPDDIDMKQIEKAMQGPQGQLLNDFMLWCHEQGVDPDSAFENNSIEKLNQQYMQTPREIFGGKTPADSNAGNLLGGFKKVETIRREQPKVGRNDPCPCGSGKKYKKCCGKGK